jgi:uncharacterized protein HemX
MFSAFGRTRVAAALVGAVLALTVIAPGSAVAQDMRTPDARDPGEQASPSEDRRSPDARDVALESEPVADEPSSPGGFDLVSAAIGAAAGTGLLIVLAAFLGIGGLAGHAPRMSHLSHDTQIRRR